MSNDLIADYEELLQDLKKQIRNAQIKAALSVNRELVLLYWQLGKQILLKQQQEGWGAKVIERLSKDLRGEFPQMNGLSSRNLKYMRFLAESYPDEQIVQQLVAQIPWGHNVRILDKVKNLKERLWYIQQTIENGWSRNVLVHQIESDLYKRQGSAISNFDHTLIPTQSDLAKQLIKDPYNFGFLSLGKEAQERDLENALIDHMRDFLLELGVGFAFVVRQYHLEMVGEDFYIDLLFYHLRLRCFVVIDLKMDKFKPEFSGKMSFYVSAIDDLLKHPDDQPTIGIILCKTKNQTIAEYSLRDMKKPISISNYQLGDVLPEQLQKNLPTVEQLEAELKTVDIKKQKEGS